MALVGISSHAATSITWGPKHVEAKVEDLPLILIGLDHDGPGPPLQKQFKRTTAMEES